MSATHDTFAPSDGVKGIQLAFGRYIRSGEEGDRPVGLEARRMEIYRDLFFKNIAGFCSGVYPVLMSVVTEVVFMQMVRQFMKDHRAKTPYFHQISEEFYAWLVQQEQFELPPYGLELAHYEWLELAIDVMDVENACCDPNGDCWSGAPVLSASLECPSYHYAVHKVTATFTDGEALLEPTFLAVWRNRHDDVKFMEMNAVTWSLLTHLQQQPSNGEGLVTGEMAAEHLWTTIGGNLGVDRATFMAGARQTLENLKENGIVLGAAIDDRC